MIRLSAKHRSLLGRQVRYTDSHADGSGSLYPGLGACLLLFCLLPVPAQAETQTMNIGVLTDGPWLREQQRIAVVKDEILALTQGEFEVRFPADKQLHGDWTLKGLLAAIEQLEQDPEVDLIIAMGLAASSELTRRTSLKKPVVAPIIVSSSQQLPFRDGRSGVPNLNYVASFNRLEQDIIAFIELVPFEFPAIIVDPLHLQTALRYQHLTLANQYESLEVIPASGTVEEILETIPEDADAVIVTPLLSVTDKTLRQLAQGLAERKLPSLSMFGRNELQLGLLATLTPESDVRRLARRVAINVQRILLGEDPGAIEVEFDRSSRLMINMETARAINLVPSYRLLTQADLLNDGQVTSDDRLTLKQALEETLANNLALKAAATRPEAAAQARRQALANLLPQLEVSLEAAQIDDDRAIAARGTNAEKESSGSLSLTQPLYVETAWAGLSIQERLFNIAEADFQVATLDEVLTSAQAFLNVLRSETLERVRLDDLRLTESNLERAEVRLRVGSANRAEVFRWQSEIASSRRELTNAEVQSRQARVNLDRLLNRDLSDQLRLEPPTLEDPNFLISDQRIKTYMVNAQQIQRLLGYLVYRGLQSAPEIRAAREAKAASQRQLTSLKRRFYVPTVALQANYREVFQRSGAGSDPLQISPTEALDDQEWSIGIQASFPLYLGGGRYADKRVAQADLEQADWQLDLARQVVESRIRSEFYATHGAYTNIGFAEDAERAAADNLELVSDSYARGVVSIIDLLDAQTAALQAKEASANAVYDFMLNYFALQRAMGRFELFIDDADRVNWFAEMESFLKRSSALSN